MDPTVQVAFISVLTVVVSTAGAVVLGIVNSKKERGAAAESAMEATLRERIVLRDEQINDLKDDLQERDHTIVQLNEELTLWREGRLP